MKAIFDYYISPVVTFIAGIAGLLFISLLCAGCTPPAPPAIVLEMESTEEGVFCLYDGHRWQSRNYIGERRGGWICSTDDMLKVQ